MPYFQKDIVKVKAKIPNVEEDSHPFLILSCESANKCENERSYVGVMMTHSNKIDRFSFSLSQEMIDGNIGHEKCQLRLHIIVKFLESNISSDSTKYVGKMKKNDFKEVLRQINELVLCCDN